MDRLGEFLEIVKQMKEQGDFLGLLHILIGRKVSTSDGTQLSSGLTWREAAALLKKVRWKKESVIELGLAPSDLPPRDRVRYWLTAIMRTNLNSIQARDAGDRLAKRLSEAGYVIGAPPSASL